MSIKIIDFIGSKCPSGEFLYVVKAEDVRRMKDVFSDLAHHKPIFHNDRTGRRMTQEHIMLQKLKERQHVGPRLSLPHNTTAPSNHFQFKRIDSDLAARPRSNALVTERENSHYSSLVSSTNQLKSSPSASDIHCYYNLPPGGTEEYKRKTNSLSTNTLPSHQEDNVYYNRDAIEMQLKMRATNNDSDTDDDDFVDIKCLRNSDSAIYYNLRDNALLLKKAKAKQFNETDTRPAYENYTPKFRKQ